MVVRGISRRRRAKLAGVFHVTNRSERRAQAVTDAPVATSCKTRQLTMVRQLGSVAFSGTAGINSGGPHGSPHIPSCLLPRQRDSRGISVRRTPQSEDCFPKLGTAHRSLGEGSTNSVEVRLVLRFRLRASAVARFCPPQPAGRGPATRGLWPRLPS